LVTRVTEELLDFFEDDGSRAQNAYILAISGEIGSGKTLFARCLIEKLKKRKDILRDQGID
jgi:tRNA A37 threonylcarbamoyladenosine biosynthesis protein TsaE